jgi:hypothetical protein
MASLKIFRDGVRQRQHVRGIATAGHGWRSTPAEALGSDGADIGAINEYRFDHKFMLAA